MDCKCDNCGWVGIDEDTEFPIPRLHERVSAGDEMPVGECPKCGALAYIDKNPTGDLDRVLDRGRDECGWSTSSVLTVVLRAINQLAGVNKKCAEIIDKEIQAELQCEHETDWNTLDLEGANKLVTFQCSKCECRGTIRLDKMMVEWEDEE